MSVLILAHPSDAVAGLVVDELGARGVRVHGLNPSEFPQRLGMAARISEAHGGPGF